VKEHLKQLVSTAENDLQKRNLAREYLQARTLQALQDAKAFLNWLFLGGTALRFLYSIPRYSEDLDFSLVDGDSRFRDLLKSVKSTFESEDYRLVVKVSDEKTVQSAFMRFQGLPYELGFSSQQSENLSIKIEVDTNPPGGARWKTTLIRRHVTLNLSHYDKPSLLAGKMHAILARPYVKGRDLYDLIWYLADSSWPSPNLEFLNAALAQTKWRGGNLTEKNWRQTLMTRLESVNWKQAIADVSPFLERPSEVDLLSFANCEQLLKARKA